MKKVSKIFTRYMAFSSCFFLFSFLLSVEHVNESSMSPQLERKVLNEGSDKCPGADAVMFLVHFKAYEQCLKLGCNELGKIKDNIQKSSGTCWKPPYN